jgi:hypothetical protein
MNTLESNKDNTIGSKELDQIVGKSPKMEDAMIMDSRDKSIIIFALGRCYILCQLLGQDSIGTFTKGDFKNVAEKLGAKIN